MAEPQPLSLAVVGHTNAGKTSLLRTLSRRRDFGQVADRPGTTRHVEALAMPGLQLLDTPGLEDAVGLQQLMLEQPAIAGRPRGERVAALLASPAAAGDYEQEAKVLRALQAADAGLLVIDARASPALPKYAAELELLGLCGRPLMPVLNFVRSPDSQEAAWQALLASHGLHALLRFDAVAPFIGAETQLLRDLGTLLPQRRALLKRLAGALEQERRLRRSASLRLIATGLLELAALRSAAVSAQALDAAGARSAFVRAFQLQLNARLQRERLRLLDLHGFGPDTAEAAALPQLAGRWEADLFNPELLKKAGRQFGRGAAVGGALGLAADVALAGLSLGTGTTLGAVLGGMASQGLGPLGRCLALKLRGQLQLSLEDAALLQIAAQDLSLMLALEQRGHAALEVLRLSAAPEAFEAGAARALLAALQPARAQPEWAQDGGVPAAAVDAVLERLRALLEPAAAGAGPRA